MVRQEAWRRDIVSRETRGFGTYTESVRIALLERHYDAKLSIGERGGVEQAFNIGLNPVECAWRIIGLREMEADLAADAAYEARLFWEDVEMDDGIPVISKHGDRETI